MTKNQINKLFAEFATVKTISIENYRKLKAVVSFLPNAEIEKLANSAIRFVNTAANSVLVDRKIRSEDARIDHAARIICESAASVAA